MSLKLSSFLFLLTTPFLGYAQIRLTGRITDNKNQPIEFANVFLSNSKGKLITGTTTDSKGNFRLSTKKGTYILSVSFVGFSDYKNEVVLDKDKGLGFIVLKEATDKLKGVVVTAKKRLIEQKVDRLVFNVENSIAASGGDALDALKVTPRVRVQNDQISMIGKGNMRVMVNDRIIPLTGEDLVNYLRSISSDDIKSIEVITNPPAKYSAEGNSGIINIVLKKVKKDSWKSSIISSYKQATYPVFTMGGSYMYNKNRWSVLANLSSLLQKRQISRNSEIFYPEQNSLLNNNQRSKKEYISGRLNLGYQIDSSNSVVLQYMGNVINPKITYTSKGRTDMYGIRHQLDSLLLSNNSGRIEYNNHAFNLNYTSKLGRLGKTLSVDGDYFDYLKREKSLFKTINYYPDNTPTGFNFNGRNENKQKIENYSLGVDIQFPNNIVNINYGGRLSFTKKINDYHELTQKNYFEYRENIQAIYLEGQKNINDRWIVKLGLRAENTQIEGISESTLNNKDSYLKWFPTAFASYKYNQSNVFNFSYGKRINRPDFWELNPFRWYTNAYSYSEGNPFLQPSFTHNLDLNHVYKNELTTSISVSITTNGNGQIPNVDDNTAQTFFTRENYFTNYNYAISGTYTKKITNHWQSYNQAKIYYSHSKIDRPVKFNMNLLKGFGYFLLTTNTISFNDSNTIQAELQGWYNNSGRTYNMYEISNNVGVSIGMRLLLFKKNMQISANFNDIFKGSVVSLTTYTYGVKQIFRNDYDPRYFKISVSYNFGNDKISAKKVRFGNKEELKRSK